VPELVDRWLAGELDVAPLLSHTPSLDQVNDAFELMEAQAGVRSVVEFH
jgi:S-(hydroxymethyl)glutathione dehydrogenase/alcohol dehydrogenase